MKHAEMRGPDTGIVRFTDEKDAELAISKRNSSYLLNLLKYSLSLILFLEFMDGARFDNQAVYVSFF